MFKRALTGGLLLTLAVTGVHAQQQAPPPAPVSTPAPASGDKVQEQYFETLLASSVVAASRVLAEVARQVEPGLQLTLSNNPIVRGWWSPGVGYQYFVEPPSILPTNLIVFQQAQQMRGGGRIIGGQGGSGGANGTGAGPVQTGQSTITQSDPMAQTPVKASTGPINLGDVYRDAVYEKLYDVLLDNSGALPIKDDELLQVVMASSPSMAPFIDPDSRKLILQIRGADLRALHEHRITKEEARKRVVETRF